MRHARLQGARYLSPSYGNSIAAAAEPLHLFQLWASESHRGPQRGACAALARRILVASEAAAVVVKHAFDRVVLVLGCVEQLLRLRFACGALAVRGVGAGGEQ